MLIFLGAIVIDDVGLIGILVEEAILVEVFFRLGNSFDCHGNVSLVGTGENNGIPGTLPDDISDAKLQFTHHLNITIDTHCGTLERNTRMRC